VHFVDDISENEQLCSFLAKLLYSQSYGPTDEHVPLSVLALIHGTIGMIQGTIGMIQGTIGMIQGTIGMIQEIICIMQ
jgi:hypothetical protein